MTESLASGAPPIQRKVEGPARAEPRGAAVAPTGDPGRALPEAVRREVEESFDSDFSSVRIHEGAEAAAVGALAYTQGEHIYFQPGRFDPGSAAGMELLGHELGHVVQQRQGRVANGGEDGVVEDGGLEAEADSMGAKAGTGRQGGRGNAHAPAAAGGPIQRRVDSTALTAGAYAAAVQQLQFAVRRTHAGARLWEMCEASPTIHLIFENDATLKAENKQYARTRLLLGGADINERIMNHRNSVVTEHDRAARIEVRIGLAPDWKAADDLGVALETITHEFAIHAIGYTDFIAKLRGNGDIVELSRAVHEQLSPMSENPKLALEYQHYQLASKTSVVFNVLTEFMGEWLRHSGKEEAAVSLGREIDKDVGDHSDDLMWAPMYGKVAQKRRNDNAAFLAGQIVGIVTNNPWVRRQFAGVDLATLKERLMKEHEPEKLAHLARGYDDAALMERALLAKAATTPPLRELMSKANYLELDVGKFVAFFNSDPVQSLLGS